MKTRKILLNIDLFFQGLLFFGALGTGLLTAVSGGDMAALFAFALLLLGMWQLASGVIMGIILDDGKRLGYFMGSIIYLILLFVFGQLVPSVGKNIGVILAVIFIAIIPMGIAYWYLRMTNLTLNEMNGLGEVVKTPEDFEDILDSEEIFKPIGK